MNKRTAPKHFLLLLLVLMVALSISGVASAQQGLPKAPDQAGLTAEAAASMAGGAVRLPDGRIQVIVTLSADPAVTAFINNGGRSNNASARAAAANQQAAVRQEQAAFAAQAGSLGATVARSTAYIVNSVTVQINPNQVAALSRLPGVLRVDADLIVERTDTVSVPFMGADDAWTDGPNTGFTGAGTVIAVIDSGIDYIHTDFGGSGDYADNPDTTDGTDSDFFPADFPFVGIGVPKVIGGTDYVGDDYDATGDEGSPTPSPDADPIDCSIDNGGGHGTHVSGTAAGWGVNDDGSTYLGPYDNTIFPSFPAWTNDFRIGPGVAPEAALVAMRVFGCNGSTSTAIIISAIDDAVSGVQANDIQADVINMSLGSPYGYQDENSIDNVAINNASLAGTIVVMSAGNNGDFFFITGSPGQANDGIAVASAVDPGNQARAIELNDLSVPEDTLFAAAYGAGSPFFHPELTAIFERPAPNPDGCTEADFANFTPGNIALIDRGGAAPCGFAIKQDLAFLAGASGVVVANVPTSANPTQLVTMVAPTNPDYDLPSVHVNLASGDALRAAADGTNTITMSPGLGVTVTEPADFISGFSSRGPSRQSQGSFKPDLAAPGQSILSAGSGTGEFPYNISGTSMASPHIAGAMALLREKYPTWSVAALKALIMNTSNNPMTDGVNTYGPQRVGSGRTDLADTFAAGEVIAYNTDNAAGVSVSFGAVEVVAGNTLAASKTITLENLTATPVDYDVTFTQGTNMVGVSLATTETTVSVPANGTATVTVNLTGDPNVAGVNTNSDPTLVTANRHYLTEETGYVVFTPTAGSTQTLQVGIYAAPRVNAAMTATDSIEIDTATGSTSVTLAGTGVETGATPGIDIVSAVSAFELVAASPNEAGTPDNADLAHFGIYSDYPVAAEGAGQVYFAFNSYGDWNSLNEVIFQVMLDYDFDGAADFAIFNDSATGAFDTFTVEYRDINGIFGEPGLVYTENTVPNVFPGNQVNTYAMNNNVIFLPFPLEVVLGDPLVEAGPSFDYWIETYSARYEDPETEEALLVDSLGSAADPLTYNPETPAYQFTGGLVAGLPVFQDADAGVIGVDYNFTSGAPDIMLLHHHNAASAGRAELVDIITPAAPGDFALISPANGAVITDPASVTAITWGESAEASTYNFLLLKLSGNTDASALSARLDTGEILALDGLTGEADVDPLTCAAGVCTLTVDALTQAELTDGTYAWTVFADNGFAETEASNAAFLFKVNTGDIELLVNGDFELAGEKESEAASWTIKNKSGDKRKVDGTQSNSGIAYFAFKGKPAENAKISQKASDNAPFANVGVVEGDVLTAQVFVNTEVATAGKLTVKVKYEDPTAGANGNGKDKIVVNLVATTGYQAFSGELTSDGTVTKLVFIVGFTSPSGKMLVDDASLVRGGLVSTLGTRSGGGDALPLPQSGMTGSK